MDYEIPDQKYKEIEQLISSDESVVGIDAKKTHIILIHLLLDLHKRVDAIEEQLDKLDIS
jgi:divalent metal cation (Fe/Co/Zn/Cd) transporter